MLIGVGLIAVPVANADSCPFSARDDESVTWMSFMRSWTNGPRSVGHGHLHHMRSRSDLLPRAAKPTASAQPR